MLHKSFFIFCLFLSSLLYSQEVLDDMHQQVENWAEVTDELMEDDAALQQLIFLKKHPVNLNLATADELQVFFFLTDVHIQNLLQYRKVLKNFISIYELQAVPGWNTAVIRKLLPYVTVAVPLSVKEGLWPRFREGEHQLLLRSSRILEKAKGYDTTLSNHYYGDRNHLFLRYRYQYKNLLQYGVTADKDAGETFFRNTAPGGFDFYSAHVFARNMGVIKALALGDFTVNLGQGLIHWQSMAFKKSSEVISIKRQSPVLKPYTSSGEFYFNRGAGITIKKGKMESTAFASVRNLDASVDIDTLTGNESFSGFLPSGLHRTAGELANRNTLQQSSWGANLSYEDRFFKIGFNTVNYRFSKPLHKRDEPYNIFALKGDSWSNASIDYSAGHKNIHFFGEAALDKSGHKALVHGALISVDPKIDVSLLYRFIEKEYQTVYGNAFTENILPSNENGMYTGLRIRPRSFFTIDAYADFYKFSWLKYRVDAPGFGRDYLVQLTWQPTKQFELYTRYRNESKLQNETETNGFTNYTVLRPRQNWRIHFSHLLSPNVSVKGRADMVWYDKKGKQEEKGFLLYAEGSVQCSPGFAVNGRLQYFETEGYNSRVYAYEHDVLFSYSTPAFFDEGFRYYANVQYKGHKRFSAWLRWAQTIYHNKEVISSSLEEIKGNKRSEIKLQLQVYF